MSLFAHELEALGIADECPQGVDAALGDEQVAHLSSFGDVHGAGLELDDMEDRIVSRLREHAEFRFFGVLGGIAHEFKRKGGVVVAHRAAAVPVGQIAALLVPVVVARGAVLDEPTAHAGGVAALCKREVSGCCRALSHHRALGGVRGGEHVACAKTFIIEAVAAVVVCGDAPQACIGGVLRLIRQLEHIRRLHIAAGRAEIAVGTAGLVVGDSVPHGARIKVVAWCG